MTWIFLWLISNSAQVKDRLNLSGASLCYKLVPYTLARTMLCVSQNLGFRAKLSWTDDKSAYLEEIKF